MRILPRFSRFPLGRLVISAILVGLLVSPLAAEAGALPAGGKSAAGQVVLLEADDQGVTLELVTPEFELAPSSAREGDCELIRLPGYAQAGQPGYPSLPVKGSLVGIPAGSEPDLEILEVEASSLPGFHAICPVSRPLVEYSLEGGAPAYRGELAAPLPEAYSVNRFLPEEAAVLAQTAFIRNQRVARLVFQPFQYNPASGELRLNRRIQVRLAFHRASGLPEGGTPAKDASLSLEGPFESLLAKNLVNYRQAQSFRAPRMPHGTAEASLTSLPAKFKLLVDQEGIFKVTYADLAAAGADLAGLNPRTFQLYNQGQQVPILVEGEADGSFDPGDALLFYGRGVDNRYTTTNVYFLNWGAANGARMLQINGTPGGLNPPVSKFLATRRIEEDHKYFSSRPSGPEGDVWYWDYLFAAGSPATRQYSIRLDNISSETATARLRGLLRSYAADPHHHTRLYLNGRLVYDQTWSVGAELAFDLGVPQAYLLEGENLITVEAPSDGGIAYEIVITNWFEIAYWSEYQATDDRLSFTGGPGFPVSYWLDGFSNNQVRIFDVTNPLQPSRLVSYLVKPQSGQYRAVFDHYISSSHRYLALTLEAYLAPSAILPETPSDLKNPANAADYLVITHEDFKTALQPLLDWRVAQGYQVMSVGYQDVLDEFNYGVLDSQAVQNFLAYAYQNWATPPSYVLAVGDGSFDPRDNWGLGQVNYIPPYLAQVDPWLGETAADNRFVTVSGTDNFPDMFFGRLPANSEAETQAMVEKILAYEQAWPPQDWSRRLLFVADNPDIAGQFHELSETVANQYTPPFYSRQKVYLGVTHTYPAARAEILAALDEGRLIVNYIGHSSIQWWAQEGLFGIDDVFAMNNAGRLPLMMPMTCLDGYYHSPSAPGFFRDSLSESLVRVPAVGAIASFAPTGFGVASGHDWLNQGFYQAVFQDGITQVGAAALQAKLNLYLNSSWLDLLDTYLVLGDPALRLQAGRFTFLPLLPFTTP